MSEKIKLQFDFTKPVVDRLDEMVQRLDASSRAEVVRRALAMLDKATQQKPEVVLRYENGVEKIILP